MKHMVCSLLYWPLTTIRPATFPPKNETNLVVQLGRTALSTQVGYIMPIIGNYRHDVCYKCLFWTGNLGEFIRNCVNQINRCKCRGGLRNLR